MCEELAISVRNISKIYKLYDKPIQRVKESLNPFGKTYYKEFYALRGIDLDVKKGQTLGIIGRNGSGKSTLLKIITGVLMPSSGTINTSGRMSSLLELGAGFNGEYTGIENIYLNGTIMGYGREEMDSKLQSILDFADIGDYIYQPVKTYSSGMFVRLAFALVINVEPDILLIDEALAVGDIRFQQKCFRKIMELKKDRTILMVTHDMGAILNFCDRVIWLNDGMKVEDGVPSEVIKHYQAYMDYDSKLEQNEPAPQNSQTASSLTIDTLQSGLSSFGEGSARIVGASLYDERMQTKVKVLRGGEKVNLLIQIKAFEDIGMPIVGFVVKDSLGYTVTDTNTLLINANLGSFRKGRDVCLKFEFKFPSIRNGKYMFSIAIAEGTRDNHVQHHWIYDALIVEVMRPMKDVKSEGLYVLEEIDTEILR